jgi:hypothetical protein
VLVGKNPKYFAPSVSNFPKVVPAPTTKPCAVMVNPVAFTLPDKVPPANGKYNGANDAVAAFVAQLAVPKVEPL